MTTPRIIASFSIGGTSENQSTRCVGIKELMPGGKGWGAFVDHYALPALELGAAAIELHNPFGTLPKEAMQADQYLTARSVGLRELVDGFVAAWRRVTARGVQVIGYMGGLTLDDDFAKLRPTAYLRRTADAFEPILMSDMTLGVDYDAMAANRSHPSEMLELLASFGVPLVLESWWAKTATWGHRFPVMIGDDFYRTIRAQGFPGWARRPSIGMPEVMRIIRKVPDGEPADWSTMWSWAPRVAQEILNDGHSVMIGGYPFVETPRRPFSVLRAPA